MIFFSKIGFDVFCLSCTVNFKYSEKYNKFSNVSHMKNKKKSAILSMFTLKLDLIFQEYLPEGTLGF